MNKNKKYFILVFFIFYLCIDLHRAFCDEEGEKVNASEEQGGGFYATSPNCTSGIAEVIIAIYTIKIAALDFIIPGAKKLVKAKNAKQKALAMALLLTGNGMVYTVTASMSTALQCFYAFVKDPIVYQDDDVTKPMLDKNHRPTSNAWEADKAVYSKNIKVCARQMPPYIAYFFPPYQVTNSYSCYNTNSNFREDVDDIKYAYDGQDAYLCPEEWRFHRYKYKIEKDPNKDKTTKTVVRGNGATDEVTNSSDKQEIVMSSTLEARKRTGPLECKSGKIGDTLSIHGYHYKIVKMGAKICAVLKGLGNLPSISGSFLIGCHYTTPDDPSPLCDNSTPIYAKDSNNNPILDPATGKEILVDWNNSGCFSCFVDSSCFGQSAGHSKAVIPLTSFVMECMHQTLDNVILGCVDKNSGDRGEGMLIRINKKFKNLIYLAIVLCIAFFGLKILFSNNLPKLHEMLFMVLKIGVVLYCTSDSENNGLIWLHKQIDGLSSGLSSIVLSASSYTTQTSILNPANPAAGGTIDGSEPLVPSNIAALCRFEDSMYHVPVSSTNRTPDFSFIKPYDMLDCKLFFYLGGSLFGYDYSQSGGMNIKKMVGNLSYRLLAIIFPLLALIDPTALLCALFLLLFALMVFGMTVWLVSLLVLSMITIFILILIAPLVLPMMLFEYTKSMFDSWTKELMAYVLFPPLLFLFFGLVMAVFDVKLFGDTKFVPIDVKIGNRNATHFVFQDINCTNNTTHPVCKKCREFFISMDSCDGCDPTSLACLIRQVDLQKNTSIWGQGNITINKRKEFFLNMLESIGFIILMAIIFYTLVTTIAFLLSEMLGKVRSLYEVIGHGVSPMTAFLKSSKFGLRLAKKSTVGSLKAAFSKATKKSNSDEGISGRTK